MLAIDIKKLRTSAPFWLSSRRVRSMASAQCAMTSLSLVRRVALSPAYLVCDNKMQRRL